MEYVVKTRKILENIKKHKYTVAILVIGILFLLLPTGNNAEAEIEVISKTADNILSVEEQLTQILCCVKGAGKVQVMLSIASGEETLYQTNEKHSSDADRISNDIDTVTITDSDRNQSGLVRQVNPPVYSGAIIVCQGADNPTVRLSIIDAVSKITGLRTDKISVIKMK